MLIARDVSPQLCGQSIVLLPDGQIERMLRSIHRLPVLSRLGVHRRQHLEDRRLLSTGEIGRRFKLRQSVRKPAARRQSPPQVVPAFRRLRSQLDGALQLGDSFIQLAHAGQDDAVYVMAVGRFGRQLDSLGQLLDGFLAMTAHHLEDMAHVDVRRAVVGVQLDGLHDLRLGLFQLAGFGQRAAQIVVGLRTVVIQRKRPLVFVDRRADLAGCGQRYPQLVVYARVLRILLHRQLPGRNRLGVPMSFRQLHGRVIGLVEIQRGRFDLVQAIRAQVDELGDIDGAVGGRGILHEDRRRGVSPLIDVRQIKFGV